jgi:hypothetical protein
MKLVNRLVVRPVVEHSMKSMKKAVVAATIMIAASVVDAHAGLIKLQAVSGDLDPFQTPRLCCDPQPNDVIPGLNGYLNGELVLDGDPGAKYLVQFSLFAAESGYDNLLRETGGNSTLTELANIGETISYVHTASGDPNDFLKFQFETETNDGSIRNTLINGATGYGAGPFIRNSDSVTNRTFFVSFCIGLVGDPPALRGGLQQFLPCNFLDPAATTGDVAWLALDDGGGAPDDNHDDWVGVVRVSRVPDGGITAGLLGAALLGLSVLRRRFNA